MIDCGLLSGLIVRHFQKPWASIVISGLGPNLSGGYGLRWIAIILFLGQNRPDGLCHLVRKSYFNEH
ncbi:hypothetical protein DD563_15055 [Pelagicola sp. LXJ1103]|nr:hypothetical protein DD563_15055 [Pelagicola sp. LXJ1103]